MSRFTGEISRSLTTISPLQVVYAMGIRGRSAEKVANIISQRNHISARKIANLIETPTDFMSREKFTELTSQVRGQIASILSIRKILGENDFSRFRSESSEADIQKRISPLLLLAANKLYHNHNLNYLASRDAFPPQAVIDYVDHLSKDLSPEIIKQVFPEGYLFREYFFWIDFPLKNAYVFKFKNEFFFHFSNTEIKFTLKSRDYGKLLLKALNALIAYYMGASNIDLNVLQVVPSRNCNDKCQFCPFVLDNAQINALTNEQADKVIEFLNNNKSINTLLFVGNGEPFLNYPAILRILRGAKYVKNVGLYTNGFWGSKAEQYLSELSASNPKTNININLSIDIQHSTKNTKRAILLLKKFITMAENSKLQNINIHLRGLLFNGAIEPNDPMWKIFDDFGYRDAKLKELVSKLERGEKVELFNSKSKVLISYNHLRTPSDPKAIPENLKEWYPSLIITDTGALGIGSYEVITPVLELEDFMPISKGYELAKNNILFHFLKSPTLVEQVKKLANTFPDIFDRTYLASDLLKNVYIDPAKGLTFMLMLCQCEYKRDPTRNQFLKQVLDQLGITEDFSPKEIKEMVDRWMKLIMPAAITTKKNWWANEQTNQKQESASLNRWFLFWEKAEQERAKILSSSFSPNSVITPVKEFLQKKYGLEDSQINVSSISLTGSSIYSFSRTTPINDVDYIVTINHPGITDIFNIRGTKNSVWVISEEYLRNDSTHALSIDLAINIENGLVLYGKNPIPVPAPIIERAKMAYFYANLIQRIIFDRNLRDSFKRMVEMKRVLLQIKQCLESDPEKLGKTGIIADEDQKNFAQIRKAFERSFSEFRYDQLDSWRKFDEIVTSKNQDLQVREMENLFAEATLLKTKLLNFISEIEPLYKKNELYQESRQQVYAIFNASKPLSSSELHEEFLRDFSNDYSIILTLAANSPHPSIKNGIKAIISRKNNPFTPEQTINIQKALENNPHFQPVDYSKIMEVFTFDETKGGHKAEVRTVDFLPRGGKLITAGYDGKVMVVESLNNKVIKILDGFDCKVQCAKASRDGKMIATASRDGKVRIFDTNYFEEIFRLDKSNGGHSDWVMWVDFSHDNQYLISAGWDGRVFITDLQSERVVHTFNLSNHVRVASFNPKDHSILFAGDDGLVYYYTWPSCQLKWVNNEHKNAVLFATFNHIGNKSVSTGDSGKAIIVDTEKQKVDWVITSKDLPGKVGNIRAADFSPNDDYLALVDSNEFAWIIDLYKRKVSSVFCPEPVENTRRKGATSVRFSPDGTKLAIARADGVVKLFQFQRGK